ncbi:hypothetical protein STSO111631_19040 [Stackebrandtia soli]
MIPKRTPLLLEAVSLPGSSAPAGVAVFMVEPLTRFDGARPRCRSSFAVLQHCRKGMAGTGMRELLHLAG